MDQWEKAFLKDIVMLDTNSDEKKNYLECSKVIEKYCEEAGLKVEIFDISPGEKPQPNVVATLDVGAKETVLLCTHYDIVPAGEVDDWTRPPFDTTIEADKIYGRGVTDNKGNVVAAVAAAKELAGRGSSKVNYKILISPNEEIGGVDGIEYLINGPPKIRGDFAIVVDSGPTYVSIGASGVVSGTITVQGTQGHAGYPFKFPNAVHLSIPVMEYMLDYVDVRKKVVSEFPSPPDSPQQTLWGRFSMTILKAGSKTNVIPGKVEISFDCRTIPEEDVETVAKNLEEFLGKAIEETGVEASLEFITKHAGWGSDPENRYIKTLHAAVNESVGEELAVAGDLGGNDGYYFTSVGIPTACYGTIEDDSNFHGIDEWLSIKAYEKVKNALIQFAEKCE